MNVNVFANHQDNHDVDDKSIFGFWVYLMSDCILFASLFAVYAVLHHNTFGGPSAYALFSMPFVLVETFILLTSSFTMGLAMLAAHRKYKFTTLTWLCVTAALGGAFLFMEMTEFSTLVAEGNSWQRSGFLSSFFTLVGTHGLHVTTGLLWMGGVMVQIFRRDLTAIAVRNLTCLSLFWHFLDIIWIFIFTTVYLMGAI